MSKLMNEYVKREDILKLQRKVTMADEGGWLSDEYAVLVEDIENIPASDVAPVLQGNWIHNKWNDYTCSYCKSQYIDHGAITWNYCPHCGARMEGVSESMLNIKDMIELAEESGIGVEKDSSHNGIFYEDQDGNVHELGESELCSKCIHNEVCYLLEVCNDLSELECTDFIAINSVYPIVRCKDCESIKAKAIKEFVERLRNMSSKSFNMTDGHMRISHYTIPSETLDYIIKELTGDEDNG